MADNPRLTIELVDRGGTASPGYPGSSSGSAGGAGLPYDPSKDIQQRITDQGIPVAPVPVQTQVNPPPVQDRYQGPQAASGDLTALVKGIMDQDKDVTSSELAAFLKIKEETAREYMQRLAPPGQTQPTTAPASAPSTAPATQPAPAPVTSLDRFTDRVKDNILTNQEKYDQYVGQLDKALTDGKLTQEEYKKALAIGKPISELETFAQRVQQSQVTPEEKFTQTVRQTENAVNQGLLQASQADRYLERQYNQLPSVRAAQEGNEDSLNSSQISHLISNLSVATGFSRTSAGGALQVGLNAYSQIGMGGLTAAGTLGVVGTAVAAGLYGGYRTTQEVNQFAIGEANRAVGLTRELSPDVAGAEAVSELRRYQADLRTSQTLGPQAAKFVNESSIFNTSAQGIRDSVGVPVLNLLNRHMETITKFTAGFDKFLKEPGPQAILGGANNESILTDSGATIVFKALPKPLQEYFEGAKKEADKVDSPFQWFDNEYPHLPLPFPFVETNSKPFGEVNISPIPGLKF